MKYYKTQFVITASDGRRLEDEMLMQTARDVVAALAGEAGFESFEETESGLEGYVQMELFDRDMLEMSMSAFPMEDVKVKCETTKAENRNWNEDWENSGFEPIIVDGKCVVHDRIKPYVGPQMPLDVVIEARQASERAIMRRPA